MALGAIESGFESQEAYHGHTGEHRLPFLLSENRARMVQVVLGEAMLDKTASDSSQRILEHPRTIWETDGFGSASGLAQKLFLRFGDFFLDAGADS